MDSLIEAEEEISEAAVVDKDAVVGTTTTIEAVLTTITIEATLEEGVEVAAMVMATPSTIPEVVTITTEEEAGEAMIVMPTLLKEDQLQQKRSFIRIL